MRKYPRTCILRHALRHSLTCVLHTAELHGITPGGMSRYSILIKNQRPYGPDTKRAKADRAMVATFVARLAEGISENR